MKRAVVLLSGGLDSATCLAIANAEGFACYALSFAYGQRHSHELEAARRVADALGVVDQHVADIDLRAFGGSALRCSVKIERITGYRRDQSRSRWRSDDTATIWLARPFDGALPVPVRMEMETLLGGFRAHLVDATLKSGDSLRRLAAAP